MRNYLRDLFYDAIILVCKFLLHDFQFYTKNHLYTKRWIDKKKTFTGKLV